MARDSVDALMHELTTWAEQQGNELRGDSAEVEILLRFLARRLGVEDLRELEPGHLQELLLGIYPRQVTVESADDLDPTIPSVRDILNFVEGTGRQGRGRVQQLRKAVDEIEPRFAETVMGPENWGIGRSIAQAMLRDDLDLSDQDAVARWIADYNQKLAADEGATSGGAGPFGVDDLFGADDLFGPDGPFGPDDPFADDPFGFREIPGPSDSLGVEGVLGLDQQILESLGLPDRLPPTRVPGEAELAAAARQSRPLGKCRELARWVGAERRIDDDDELFALDAIEAAQALGIPVPEGKDTGPGALPEMPLEPTVRSMSHLPELVQLWRLAWFTEFIDPGAGVVYSTTYDDVWADDEGILNLWSDAFGYLLAAGLPVDAEIHQRDDLRFEGVGGLMAVLLFVSRSDGVPQAELSDLVREVAAAELPPAKARKAWKSWVKAHGDPARSLLSRLEEHGAVRTDEQTAWLTPLGIREMRDQLAVLGIEAPVLPPVDEMSAADLVDAATGLDEDELSAEASAWIALRSPQEAMDELLAVASAGGPTERMLVSSIAAEIGPAAEKHWREALETVELRAYAKMALANIAGADPAGVTTGFPPGLEPEPADLAWLMTDAMAAMAEELEAEDVVAHLSAAVPPGQEAHMFEAMRRLPHPDVHGVLTRLGRLHPDKTVAKAARKAAFKAASKPGAGS